MCSVTEYLEQNRGFQRAESEDGEVDDASDAESDSSAENGEIQSALIFIMLILLWQNLCITFRHRLQSASETSSLSNQPRDQLWKCLE